MEFSLSIAAAPSAIMPMASSAAGPDTAVKVPASFGSMEMIPPIPVMTGPVAAASAAMRSVPACVTTSAFRKESISFVARCTVFLKPPSASFHRVISRPSRALLNSVTSPLALSSMVAAISSAAPVQLSIAPVSLASSSSDAFISVRKPDMAFCPTRAFAAAVFSLSVSPAKAFRQSARMSEKERMVPSALAVLIVTLPRFFPSIAMSPFKLVIILRREVPAWDALIPLLAMMPRATAVSSTEYPMVPAIAPQYLKDSPSMDTLVLALDDTAASTSAKCSTLLMPVSIYCPFSNFIQFLSAARPNAVMASVTISDVVPRSSPAAAARFISGPTAASISSVFQPAMAIYSMA